MNLSLETGNIYKEDFLRLIMAKKGTKKEKKTSESSKKTYSQKEVGRRQNNAA